MRKLQLLQENDSLAERVVFGLQERHLQVHVNNLVFQLLYFHVFVRQLRLEQDTPRAAHRQQHRLGKHR